MKKITFWSMLILIVLMLPVLMACGGDGDSNGQDSQIEAECAKVKSQIIGTWSYEAEYLTSVNPYKDLGGIYNNLGWNERSSYKTLEFKNDGTLIIDFYGEKTYSYSITAALNYNNYVDDYEDYYPYKNGGVLLKYDNFSFFVDIVKGKLILYNTSDGSPKDRYKKQ